MLVRINIQYIIVILIIVMLIFLFMLLMIDRVLKWYRLFEINLYQQVQLLGKIIFVLKKFELFCFFFFIRIPMILVGNKIDRKNERYEKKIDKNKFIRIENI
jgi:hypothetical protein